MPNDNDFFAPEEIDGQIDSLSSRPAPSPDEARPEERVVSHLHTYYHNQAQERPELLDRAWKRIVADYQAAHDSARKQGRIISMQDYQSGQQGAPAPRKKRALLQRLGVLAAVLFVGLLVGGMILMLNGGHQSQTSQKQTHLASGGTPLPKPPNPITGGKCTIDTTHPHAQESKTNIAGIYAFSSNEQSDNVLYRYDPQTRKVVWNIKLCGSFVPSGTLAQNGILYMAASDWVDVAKSGSMSYLYALNQSDGSAIWGIQFPTSVKTFAPFPKKGSKVTPEPNAGSSAADMGAIEMPTIANGIIYIVQRSGMVYAYNATTGSALWTFNSGRNAWATTKQGNGSILDPSSIQVVNGIAYFSIVDDLFALNAQTGKELWVHSFQNQLNINQNPAIDSNMVYITAFAPGYGFVMNPDTYVYAFDAQTGAQKWVSKKLLGYLNAPVAYDGHLFVTSYAGDWYTLNPVSGAVDAQKTLAVSGYGNPTLINGELYNLSEEDANNTLTVLNPDGSTKWSAPVDGKYPTIDDVQNGIVYISGRGSGLYAYSATDGKLLWHYKGYLPQPEGILSATIVS